VLFWFAHDFWWASGDTFRCLVVFIPPLKVMN
jgi:hypothetical protein